VGESFIGRATERGRLVRALDDLPRSTIAFMDGEPGIGKTALLDQIAAEASARGIDVIRFVGDDLGAAVPFSALAGSRTGGADAPMDRATGSNVPRMAAVLPHFPMSADEIIDWR